MERTQAVIPSLKCRLEQNLLQCEQALTEAASRRAAALFEPALIVVVAMSDETGRRSLNAWVRTSPDGSPIALVVGAHPLCDVPNVQGASLRHAVVLVDPTESPGWVSAIDLNTTDGLLVDGEASIRRVDARCSVRFGAGTADVFALALAPGETFNTAVLSSWIAANPFMPGARSAAAPAERASAAPTPRSITREGVTLVSALPRELGVLFLRPTEAELKRGLILGRYDRCTNRLSDDHVSRVHALVLPRRDGRLLVIDAGSTNGTDVQMPDGRGPVSLGLIKRAVVAARGVRVLIGGSIVEVR